LVDLAKTQGNFLSELERAMPTVAEAEEASLKRLVAIVQRTEEQTLIQQQAAEIAEVLDSAIIGAHLDLANPTRDSVKETLERVVKYRREQRLMIEAARTAREAKTKAILAAVSTLNAAVPSLAANQRTIANYLEVHHGLPPLGGVSIAEPISNVGALLERLKTIGQTLDTQFSRAKEVFEAAKKAAGEE
jgi:hypothetical protein